MTRVLSGTRYKDWEGRPITEITKQDVRDHAIDVSEELARGGEFAYELYAREDGQSWELERSGRVTVEALPPTSGLLAIIPTVGC